ncbi:unnamed protein product [Rotaria sp. Silwood1]|nr:unnamed protein product [Rotaria sp. Silwood1]CAF4895097.1 unnamed protein product [Rotaria sp. Silwood1]
MTPDQQHQKFNEVYTKLNAQQQQAVDTITGAVMVIAGPGTGKTQILGARIGKIFLETDTLPQNILCLTYTDAGTIAMRKRLLSFIGADAYKRLVCQIPNLSKDIVAANDSLIALNIQPQIIECTSEKDELIYLTSEIESLINKGVQPKDIAVIYKENKYGEALALFLKQKNISYYSKRQLNIFNEPIIQQLILLLNYLAAEHDRPYEGDEMLFEIFHFNFFNIKPIDIAKLSVEVAARQFGDKKTSIRELLFTKANAPAKDLFDSNGISKELKNASAIIEQLIQDWFACNYNDKQQQTFFVKNNNCIVRFCKE